MKELREIAKIYDDLLKNKVSKIIRSGFNEKEEKLFGYLRDGVSDNTISKKLYNTSPSHQSYQSLKRSLLEKCYTILFTSNTGKGYQKQRLDVSRSFLIVRILTILKLRHICMPMAEKTLKKCLKFQMFYEASELARLLSEHYAVYEKNMKDGAQYYNISKDCIDIYRHELDYAWAYQKFRSLYGTPAFENSADQMAVMAADLLNTAGLKSKRLAFYYFDVKFLEYYIRGRNKDMIDICKEAVHFFDNLAFDHESLKNVFVFHLIEIYLNNNELDQAETLILRFLERTDKKSPAYYRYKELLLRIYLFEGQMQKARSTYNYLHRNIRKLSNVFTRDRLLIYEMYLDILDGKAINFRRLNYNLNKVKQDKKGLHVPFLIARAIYYYMHDPDELIDKLDALNQYSYKYLKGEQFERTRQFIKTLNMIMNGKRPPKKGLSSPTEKLSNYGLEMVSYEKLLEFMTLSGTVA